MNGFGNINSFGHTPMVRSVGGRDRTNFLRHLSALAVLPVVFLLAFSLWLCLRLLKPLHWIGASAMPCVYFPALGFFGVVRLKRCEYGGGV